MKIKTCELENSALDWAVAQCVGKRKGYAEQLVDDCRQVIPYSPSTNWEQGGPLIEEKLIFVVRNSKNQWVSFVKLAKYAMVGLTADTPLVAAMRCLVWVALGDEVEIPDELLES